MEKEKIVETIKILNNISNQIYKGEVLQGMAKMNSVIPSLSSALSYMNEEQQISFMNDALMPALEAMEDRDGTMLADIISYEVVPVLEQL